MGWLDYHLHVFEVVDPSTGMMLNIGIPSKEGDNDDLPGWKLKIADYFSMENRSALYTYDFGDDWEHKIELEKILPRNKNVKYPLCLSGKRACPPEDCGGVGGYEVFLKAIKNPNHKEHKMMLDWIGGDFDPDHFDIKEIKFDNPKERRKNLI